MNTLRRTVLSGPLFSPPGDPPAAAPAAAPPAAAPPAAAPPAAAPPAAAPPAEGPWYKSFNLPQPATDYLEAKGIKDFGGLLKIAQDFETVARDRNVIAKPDTSDAKKLAEWEGWEALGWNKDRAKYEPKAPAPKQGEVFDPDMFKDFVDISHDERAPAGMAERIYQRMYGKMQERIVRMQGAQAERGKTAKAALDTALRGKWGDKYDANSELAKRALTALGVDEKQAGKLNAILGDAELVEKFYQIGSLIPEDRMQGGNLSGQAKASVEAARAERLALEADQGFMAIFNNQRDPRHEEFKAKRQRLINIEAGGAG